MSIRIGNTAYIDGMEPVEVGPIDVDNFIVRLSEFVVTKDTLNNLISNRPGGIVRLGTKASA